MRRFVMHATQIFHSRKNRLRFHHHSLAAAERRVVHDVMLVRRPVPQVMDSKIDNPIFLSAFHDAFGKRRATDIGKQCQNVDPHRNRNVQRSTLNVQSRNSSDDLPISETKRTSSRRSSLRLHYSTISSMARCPWRAAELASNARMA